ncbi:hypothetical protein [Hyphomonas sp.]|uniref:hypothetical protein n=1 Tax=Hyphomonas sp. TaxID=87 RepID=UPI003564BADF
MFRLKTCLAAALCALAVGCAFGSNEALIPAEDVVLPLGAFTLADTYVQNSDDPTLWDRSGNEGAYEHYTLRQEANGYWLDETFWLVFASLDDGSDEYLMQVATPEESVDGGYVYNYAVGKIVGERLFIKLPDCDDLPIDMINELELDADCTLTTYAGLKRAVAETKGAISYTTYYQLR